MALMGNQNISFGLSFEERKMDKEGRREEKEKKKKGREEEEEEEKEKKGVQRRSKVWNCMDLWIFVWNLTLSMEF